MQRDYVNILPTSRSAEETITRLALLERLPKQKRIWTQIFYLQGSLQTFLEERRNLSAKVLSDSSILLDLERTIGRKRPISFKGKVHIMPTSSPGIFKLITISDSNFWNHVVQYFIEHNYPKIARVFLSQSELRELMVGLEQKVQNRLDVLVTDLTIKEKRQPIKKTEKSRVEYDSERKWTESLISSEFDEAAERGQWFKSIGFSIYYRDRRNHPVSVFKITKQGTVSQDHLYELSKDILLPKMEMCASNKLRLFQNRGLRERNYKPSKPLSITYPNDIFKDKTNVRRFASIIKKYPNSSKAIFHGNPYFHASVADTLDGSSLELWILNPFRVLLIPQAKTTVSSLEKLVGYIFSEFREGEVAEYASEESR